MKTVLLLTTVLAGTMVHSFTQLKREDNAQLKHYCGVSKNAPRKFKVVGHPAAAGQFPWSVYLTIDISIQVIKDGKPERPKIVTAKCSGILISQRHILTAAHCLYDSIQKYTGGIPTSEQFTKVHKPLNILAQLRDEPHYHAISSQSVNFHIEPIKKWPLDLFHFDYAILEMKTPVSKIRLDRGFVRPICLTATHGKLKRKTFVAGYGYDPDKTFKDLNFAKTSKVTCPKKDKVLHIGPISKCYKDVTEVGDSGSAYVKEDKNGKSHLVGIASRHHGGVAVVIDALNKKKHPRNPLEVVSRVLKMSYSTK